MEQLIGRSLDRYKITALLGEGGMGAVFKGTDVTLQREVAIKVMHPQLARQADFQERFLQEARTAAKLDHAGIVKVFDFGQAQSHLYIVMEFIPGDNLRKMLTDLRASGQWIVLPEAIQIVQQTAVALDYAHRQGVLHRDLKPDNIMLKAEASGDLPYHPVVTDLGLAKLREGGMLTQEGTSMGTPAYMSPEQAMGESTDARSDVYSLGILLYELAVGRLPFEVRTITEAIRCHTKEPPPPPRSIRPDLPEAVEQVIMRCLEKDPADRFADAKALAESLGTTVQQASVVSTPPTALAEAVSLMTRYQQSLVEMRGPSIMADFPDVPSELGQDRVTILTAEHTTRHIPLKPGGITIGRHEENDVVLDDRKVSRQHARIEFDGTAYRITDLDSSNGTYLGNVKLLPGVPEAWTPEKALRIGDSWLRLERAKRAGTVGMTGGASMLRSDGTMLDPSLIRSSAGPARVGVFMDTTDLEVAPGSSTVASVVILNQGPVVDHFKVGVGGIPSDWVPDAPPPIRLMPGTQQDVNLTIQPPRTSKSQAGSYPVTIDVASQDMPDQVASVQAKVNVQSFSQFTSDIHPQKLRAGASAQVTVHNDGNSQETFTVSWKDRGNEVAFQPPQAQLSVPPGQAAAAGFRAAPHERRWIGGNVTYNFTANVASSAGDTQRHEGELVSRAVFPPWLLPLLLLMCLCLAGAAALTYGWKTSQDTSATQTMIALWEGGFATQTAIAANKTATAQAGVATTDAEQGAEQATAQARTATAQAEQQSAAAAATGTALSAQQANQATVDAVNAAGTATAEAATATAVWMAEDDDRDGLTNQTELSLNTLPGKRDTDEDGLDDGEEVDLGTDPLRKDTDADGLKDGDEVATGTDPKDPDTDDDGLRDNVDPNPLVPEGGDDEGGGYTILPLNTAIFFNPGVIASIIPAEDRGGAINAYVTYDSYDASSGWVTFRIMNTGDSALECAQTSITNRTTSAAYYGPGFSNSPFRSEPTSDVLVSSVAAGTTRYMRYKLSGNPSGVPCRATITLYSADDRAGLSTTKTVDFDLP